jgi:hypothetical protein
MSSSLNTLKYNILPSNPFTLDDPETRYCSEQEASKVTPMIKEYSNFFISYQSFSNTKIDKKKVQKMNF